MGLRVACENRHIGVSTTDLQTAAALLLRSGCASCNIFSMFFSRTRLLGGQIESHSLHLGFETHAKLPLYSKGLIIEDGRRLASVTISWKDDDEQRAILQQLAGKHVHYICAVSDFNCFHLIVTVTLTYIMHARSGSDGWGPVSRACARPVETGLQERACCFFCVHLVQKPYAPATGACRSARTCQGASSAPAHPPGAWQVCEGLCHAAQLPWLPIAVQHD